MSKMNLIDAQRMIVEMSSNYFVRLTEELSNPSTLGDFIGSDREAFREELHSVELSEEFYKTYLPKKDQHLDLSADDREKYSLIIRVVYGIIHENLLNPDFFLPTNHSREKKLLDRVCLAHSKALNNHHPKHLMEELKSAAKLLQIISEPNPAADQNLFSTLTRYKDELRECTGRNEVRDCFSKIVLTILHPLFVLPEMQIALKNKDLRYARFWQGSAPVYENETSALNKTLGPVNK